MLVVDGDAAYRRALALNLSGQVGIDVVDVATAAEALRLMGAGPCPFQAMLLDAQLPDGDGRALCRDVRRRFPALPILFLTDRDDDAADALDAGANDFLRKPVGLRELLARLRAHRRSLEMSIHVTGKIGPYTFRPGQRSLFEASRNQRIWLTNKEIGILRCLLNAAGAPVQRDALLKSVWGLSSGATTHTLETHIYRLRKKLGDERLLVTGNDGYKLAT